MVTERPAPSIYLKVLVSLVSILLALVLGATLLMSSGVDPLFAYTRLFLGAFGDKFGLTETIVKATPLMLTGLGVALAIRSGFFNLGAEGQFYMGAFLATLVAYGFPNTSMVILLPLMLFSGFVMGGAWGAIPALLKVRLNVNEIITTLMMNYIAILWVAHMLVGPWSYQGFPWSPVIPIGAQLPSLADSRLHAGIFFALIAAAVIYLGLMKTKWGFETRVVGTNIRAARYAGISVLRTIIPVAIISGGLAGIAGMVQVSGVTQRVMVTLSPGYGYTAVVIAFLGKLHPVGVVISSIFFGGLLVGAEMMQRAVGIPVALVTVIEALVLLLIVAGEFLTRYKISVSFQER